MRHPLTSSLEQANFAVVAKGIYLREALKIVGSLPATPGVDGGVKREHQAHEDGTVLRRNGKVSSTRK
jgi:hypothetical protein